MDIEALFDRFEDDFLKFDRIENKLHARPDMCAFLLLDKLVPGTRHMVCGAEHDEIFIDTDPDALAAVATEADILTLVRCGVRYDEETCSLAMFA